jgi:hypothetical protein
MKIRSLLAGIALTLSSSAFAAGPAYLLVDNSDKTLIDDATARSLLDGAVSARLAKLYPVNKWGFASQVSGGVTSTNSCVVTASAMLLPRNSPNYTKVLLLKPEKMSTTFEVTANATPEACREVSKRKLQEALQALVWTLAPN